MGNENSAEKSSGNLARHPQNNAQSQEQRLGGNQAQHQSDSEKANDPDILSKIVLGTALGAAAVGGILWAGMKLLETRDSAELNHSGQCHSSGALKHPLALEVDQSEGRFEPPPNVKNELNKLVRLRDRQQDLILFCVFDRAIQKRNGNCKGSKEYKRNSEVVHNAHLYSGCTVDNIRIPETRVVRGQIIQVKIKSEAQMQKEISILEHLRDGEKDLTRYCVFDRAIQEREKCVDGIIADRQRYEKNCKVLLNPHWYANQSVK